MANDAASDMEHRDLASWLAHIERLHPKSIAMGLDRVKQVIQRLSLQPKFKIITVAGTNGKGSTCAMLAEIYAQAGYQVGCYTSPHLLRYNERVRVNGREATDQELCAAFAAVEQARLGTGADNDEIALTYFEMGTLAALWHFVQAGLDVAILEIGLGGRLDAVNAFEPDCSVVTSVDLDHQEFLGDTRERIGMEKAGIYRSSVPAICGDVNPPLSLIAYAGQINAEFKCIHRAFDFEVTANGWHYLENGQVVHALPLPALMGSYQLMNASCAVAAVQALQAWLPVTTEAISRAMLHVTLAGRFQTVSQFPWVILDVAHNPHAAHALAKNLKALKVQSQQDMSARPARTIAVFAMLADKDIGGVVSVLKDAFDQWYVAGIDHVRGASAQDLAHEISVASPGAAVKVFNTATDAYKQACIDIEACIDRNENDKIVVFGSFFTVSSIMQYLNDHANNHL